MTPTILAVSLSPRHTMSKPNQDAIRLLVGLGVEGDAHSGETVKHRSRVARDPTTPNLRQVHLIHSELHDELREQGFDIVAGQMGENVTTRGLDILGLPTGARLRLGRDGDGNLVRKAGVMTIVVRGGDVRPGDEITVVLPPGPHRPLEAV